MLSQLTHLGCDRQMVADRRHGEELLDFWLRPSARVHECRTCRSPTYRNPAPSRATLAALTYLLVISQLSLRLTREALLTVRPFFCRARCCPILAQKPPQCWLTWSFQILNCPQAVSFIFTVNSTFMLTRKIIFLRRRSTPGPFFGGGETCLGPNGMWTLRSHRMGIGRCSCGRKIHKIHKTHNISGV